MSVIEHSPGLVDRPLDRHLDDHLSPAGHVLSGVVAATALRQPRYLGAKPRSRWLSLAVRISVPAGLLAFWWIGTSTGTIDDSVLAAPSEVVQAFRELWRTGQLRDFVFASFKRAGLGIAFGVSIGLVLGVLSGLTRLGEELIDPTMQIQRAVPFLALVPLFIVWFGVDDGFKVILIAFSAGGPMYAYTYTGVRNVDRKVVEAARGFGLKGPRLAFEVIIPSALPNILMALRICLAISLTGLIAAEQIGTTSGIGYLVTLSQTYFRNDYMVLCIVMYAAIGILIDIFTRLLERYAMPWRRHISAR
jgi:sulfonate transport system permease protein